VCVSCYNRALEVKAGRNRKGTPPVKAAALREVVVRYTVDGQQHTITTIGFNSTEAVVQVLRTKRGVIHFARRPNPPVRGGTLQ
jgi:hypothetical protein